MHIFYVRYLAPVVILTPRSDPLCSTKAFYPLSAKFLLLLMSIISLIANLGKLAGKTNKQKHGNPTH